MEDIERKKQQKIDKTKNKTKQNNDMGVGKASQCL